jgi:hypothetical protein
MAKKSTPFSEQWLQERNYVKSANGDYVKAIDKVKESIAKRSPVSETVGELTVKAKINNSPDFIITTPVTEWFVPYQTPSKKNSRITFTNKKTGKVVNIPSQKYTEYKNVTKKYWEVFGTEFKNTIRTLDLKFPLNIEMTFIRKTNQLVDYFGPGESVFDLMTDFHWWEDDNRKFGKPFFGDMEVDKNNPGVRIKILTNKQ